MIVYKKETKKTELVARPDQLQSLFRKKPAKEIVEKPSAAKQV